MVCFVFAVYANEFETIEVYTNYGDITTLSQNTIIGNSMEFRGYKWLVE